MSTVEKMVVQMFERNRSVIQQLKHRTDLFDDYLASVCLFEGIDPPPSLWSPRLPGLKKLETVPGVVLQSRPRPSKFNYISPGALEPILTSKNEGLPDGLSTEFPAFDERVYISDRLSVSLHFPTKDAQCRTSSGLAEMDCTNDVSPLQKRVNMITSGCFPDKRQSVSCVQRSKPRDRTPDLPTGLVSEVDQFFSKSDDARYNLPVLTRITSNDAPCVTLDGVPEQDTSATSSQDCGNTASVHSPDHIQSLVQIQRSKSRQKALELRSSVQAIKSFQHDRNVERERDDRVVTDTDVDSDRLVQAFCATSGSSIDGTSLGMEALMSKVSPDMLVKPVQLDFGDAEGCCFNETSEPELENKQKGASLETQSPTLPHSKDIFDKTDQRISSTELPLLENHEFSFKEEKSGDDSSESHMIDCDAVTEKKNTSTWQNELNSSIYHNQYTDSYHVGSWPKHKRMKISGILFTSPRLMRKPFQPVCADHVVDAVQPNVSEILIEDIDQNTGHQILEAEVSSPKLLAKKVQPSLGKMDVSADTAAALMHHQLRASLVSSLQKSAVSQGCLQKVDEPDGISIVFDPRGDLIKTEELMMQQVEDGLDLENTEFLTYTEKSEQQRRSHFGKNSSWSSCSVDSPYSQSPKLQLSDQHVPLLANCAMETNYEQSLIAREAIDIAKLELPNSALERTSVLERICKSACLHTSLSDFSTAYTFHENMKLYQSLPDGLLHGLEQENVYNINSASEHIDVDSGCSSISQSLPNAISDRVALGGATNLKGDNDKQFESTPNFLNGEANNPFYVRSEPDCRSYSNAHSAWDIRKPHSSPVGKVWDGNHELLSKSGSSEKRTSSIPDLPSISEENENSEDMASPFQNGIYAEDMTCSVQMKPLANSTKNSSSCMLVHEAQMLDRCSLASVNTEFSFTGTCKKSKRKHANQSSNKRTHISRGKENNSSLGTNGIKRRAPSHNSRFSKPKILGKASVPNLLEKEHGHSNIVSNVTTFLPLVRQKHAAAIINGKRHIEVKALEAAQAAKRLEEKKENERKMRKEAFKLERVKIEESNLRKLEVKKETEEGRKRKEAELAARKRQREEEEKDKERKRRRVGDARVQQEHKAKLHAEKGEREIKGRAQDGRAHVRKDFKPQSGKYQKMGSVREGNNLPKVAEAEPVISSFSAMDIRNSFIPENTETMDNYIVSSKEMSNIWGASVSDNLVSNILEEQSYEISPYKSSDDEDEDENDDIQNSKFIPSWASKHRVALAVSSQHGIEPKSIFSPESFCDVAEVLLHGDIRQRLQGQK